MSKDIKIGIDLMGSDTSPYVLLSSAFALAATLPSGVELYLFGSEELFRSSSQPPNIHFVICTEVVTMDDAPLTAARRKKGASMHLGVQGVKNKTIDAFISSGNTGALMATAKLSLEMLPGIDRPALLALMPNKSTDLAVLDVGANASVKSEHLAQFALMGIAFQKCRGISHPKVGLLNIGVEAKKGTPLFRDAYQKLENLNKDTPGTFVGNVEGRGAFAEHIDVLVTDGFTGNVFLKTAEGIAAVVHEQLQLTQLETCPPDVQDHLKALSHNVDIAEYPGALLCGVDGIVMKCHGEFSPKAMANTVKDAIRLKQHNFLDKIKTLL